MCLTGLDPAEHAKVFNALETQRTSDIDMLIGNAPHVPVVGVVAACALPMAYPSRVRSDFEVAAAVNEVCEVTDDKGRS